MVLQQFVEKFVEYCSTDENRQALEKKVLLPILEYLGDRFHWTLKAFQALTVLVFIQTVLLIWLLFRTWSLRPASCCVTP
jgi:hypothetical protein